jgi:hypothetical protein
VEEHVHYCVDCQRIKQAGILYGQIPLCEALYQQPFHEGAVDLIRPWHIQVRNKQYMISVLTIINTVTTMAELVQINNNMFYQAMMKFKNEWLSRYPCPVWCIYD